MELTRQCRICKNSDVKLLVELGKQPFANKYPKDEDAFSDELLAFLRVDFCNRCFCAQIPEVHSRTQMFEDYYYLSSVNTELVSHFRSLSSYLKKFEFVLDIGSNDGVLLKPLKDQGTKCLGIDPSKNVGKIANDKGLQTEIGFFDKYMVKKIIQKYGNPDCINASSVVTHLENPEDFFRNCYDLLRDNGTLIIEVEYLGSILSGTQFERFYFDRPHYYSLNSLDFLAKNAGFRITKVTEISQHGGSVRVEFIKDYNDQGCSDEVYKLLEVEKVQTFELTKEFSTKVHQEAKKLKKFLVEQNNHGKSVIGFGCPARFSTITNFLDIGPELIKFVIDDSDLKFNKFSPGKHIPIVKYSPELIAIAETILVFAYEYYDSINKRIPHDKKSVFRPLPLQKLAR